MRGTFEFCGNCIYFYPYEFPSHPIDGGDPVEVGECRKRSPRPQYNNPTFAIVNREWPLVAKDDWCGDFKNKNHTHCL